MFRAKAYYERIFENYWHFRKKNWRLGSESWNLPALGGEWRGRRLLLARGSGNFSWISGAVIFHFCSFDEVLNELAILKLGT